MSSKPRAKTTKAKKPHLNKTGKPEPFMPKNDTQKEYVRAIVENQVIYCTGPAGTGKSAVAIALASQLLMRGEYSNIIVARPCIETAKKSLGAIPGGIKEKFDPYVNAAKKEFKKFLGEYNFLKYTAEGNVLFLPLEFMRGETFNDTIMILDEAQNADFEQIKMFVTRMGLNSKVLVNGDLDQTDLLRFSRSKDKTDLEFVIERTGKLDMFAHVEFTEADIVRNPLIASFIKALK